MSGDEAPAPRVRKTRRRKASDAVTFCTVDCKYECVREAASAQGWKLIGDTEGVTEEVRYAPSVCTPTVRARRRARQEIDACNIFWVDTATIGERMVKLRPWQVECGC